VSIQKILNRRGKLEGFENSGNVGPILTRDLRKTANALDPCRILKLAVIGRFFEGEVFETPEIGLMLF
jgi:hypothetical protein